ncbi:glucose-6-phosphate isomerase [Chitinivibrio alkaliphilus]|uniref:Glucose-6-phosphate isomerase n=1 Tax=Chitinivibrio alkaliphilus ACht1 TaxID=1313304 RepID=U7D6E9_9BACT|nr:glucose-6-phosphate isomerase [Chitinivibrio alkaliphilus]ERP32094.1 Glucose-6-phosphate isomerase [Chitinivibrio alkaliphilus ACht1]
MQKVCYDDSSLKSLISPDVYTSFADQLEAVETMLNKKTGPGNDFLGWLELPEEHSPSFLDSIQKQADDARQQCDVFICVGIGGSYLGAKAAIEFLSSTFPQQRTPEVLFAGHHVNSDYLKDLLSHIEGKRVIVNVISKSGTTTEPGITFRVLRKWMEDAYGQEEAARRIIATTDPEKGALRKLAERNGYRTFDIPDNVGGRFSVLTPVGLLPIAVAGIDIKELVSGAREAMKYCSGTDLTTNIAARYGVNRNCLLREGKTIEMLAAFQPQFTFVNEWWKQLFGESEGKDRTGIFPASVVYTTDLHSMGQWMQEGLRTIFETFLRVDETRETVEVPHFEDNEDNLGYLVGKSFEYVNEKAYEGTLKAHRDGGVPAATITVADRSADSLGQLFYFFEKTCAYSAYLLRVNPFNQPGVEAYKKNMFAFLGKPGFEDFE